MSLLCAELKGPTKAHFCPAEPKPRQEAPSVLLTASECPWTVGSRILAAADCAFLLQGDLVQFSWMFARLAFDLVLAERETQVADDFGMPK